MDSEYVYGVPLFFCKWSNKLIEARDENDALGCDELAHEQDQIRHRLMNHTTELSGVQIPSRARDGNLEVDDST